MKTLTSGKKLIDPYSTVACTPTESTSGAMDNSKEGICPKCKSQMGTGIASKNEVVWYCTNCRVSSPMLK